MIFIPGLAIMAVIVSWLPLVFTYFEMSFIGYHLGCLCVTTLPLKVAPSQLQRGHEFQGEGSTSVQSSAEGHGVWSVIQWWYRKWNHIVFKKWWKHDKCAALTLQILTSVSDTLLQSWYTFKYEFPIEKVSWNLALALITKYLRDQAKKLKFIQGLNLEWEYLLPIKFS